MTFHEFTVIKNKMNCVTVQPTSWKFIARENIIVQALALHTHIHTHTKLTQVV